MAGLHVRNLHIRFDRNTVLAGLNLEVHDGEFLVLLGPSGCGKSTLLHAIAGLNEVSDGSIEIDGQDMTHADPAQRGIGMVFQSYALYPTMSVERNLSFGLRVAGMPRAEIDRRVQEAAQMLQLDQLLQRKPAQLSGGQRQRVAIGRALVRRAGIYLFDEPLSNLDAQLRAELRRELKLLHQRLGATMVYVTHDQVEAMTLATRIVAMRSGVIQQIGAPTEVYDRPANRFVAGFLGSPGMNFVRGQLAQGSQGLALRAGALLIDLTGYRFGAATPMPGQAVELGVRPEHLRLGPHGAWGGRVQLIEPMGNQQVVWVESDGLQLAALLHDAQGLKVGDGVRFDIDPARLSLFSAEDGSRL